VFDDHDVPKIVPPALKPYTHFVLDRQYEQLYGLITGQSTVHALPIGEVRELDVISPGMPDTAVSLGAANLIDHSLRGIAAGPSDSAADALYELERWVDYSSDRELRDAMVRHLVSYIRALDTSMTYSDGERRFRAEAMRALVRLTGGQLGDFLTVSGLQGIDIAMFDFRGADLTGTDFSGSFVIECDFRGATLDHGGFLDCCIRNARFDGTSLVDVDFTDADCFNALGFDTAQLGTCRTDTLFDCPATEDEFMSYLKARYRYSFRSWGHRVQRELRDAWADYTQPGGLAEDVRRWRHQELAPGNGSFNGI
jgi:hypothetical protein